MEILGFKKDDILLIFNLFKMNVRDRYLGSSLGVVWAIINPILFLGLYTFIFGFVFKAKVPGSESTFAYAIFIISGFVPYLSISESMNTTTGSVVSASSMVKNIVLTIDEALTTEPVVSASSMVKNIVFKVECLPIASTLAAAVPFCVGLIFLGLLLLIDGNYPTWHIILLIPIIIIQFAFLSGLGFFLSATSVFIRDIAQIIPTVTIMIVFFTPIFYTIEMLPKIVQKITFFNPFYHITQPYRDILLQHQLPDLKGIAYLLVLTVIFNLVGLKFFRRLKGYFTMAL